MKCSTERERESVREDKYSNNDDTRTHCSTSIFRENLEGECVYMLSFRQKTKKKMHLKITRMHTLRQNLSYGSRSISHCRERKESN